MPHPPTENVYAPYISRLDGQLDHCVELVSSWAEVNSGSRNPEGLERMLSLLVEAFRPLGGDLEIVHLAPESFVGPNGEITVGTPAQALRVRKRPHAPLRVFLGIHYDTVFPADHPFQHCRMLDGFRLNGPGVADAKGGIVVMLKALEAFEQSPWADRLGWEVLLNPDEEIGSPGSGPLLADAAANHHLGLVFEPAFPDGTFVGARRGSGNFTAVFRGRAAHAGRNPHEGRNAVNAMAEFIVALNAVFEGDQKATVNVANVLGGGPSNIVPDLALVRFNVRVDSLDVQHRVEAAIHDLAAGINRREGLSVTIHGGIARPPKLLDAATLALFEHLADCGRMLDLPVQWTTSGGASDGNLLAAAGLPTIDSMGVRGGNLHSSDEYIVVESLVDRARLTALLLMRLASGEISWQEHRPRGEETGSISR